MNIFVVSSDPIKAAQMLPDKHVCKMILESAQMLSIVYSKHYWDIGEVSKVDGTPFKTAKGAFKKHPCTIWAAESTRHCAWLLQHAAGLCHEFVHRFDKKHGLTKSIWLQFGTDIKLLQSEINFLKKSIMDNSFNNNFQNVKIFGSILIPSKQFINRFKFRPWKGVYISDKYLNSLDSFYAFIKDLIKIYLDNDICPVIETECSSVEKLEEIYTLFKL